MKPVDRTTRTTRTISGKSNRTPASDTVSSLTEDEWIQKYTGRILRAWFHQPAALGLAWTYANWIRKHLAQCYAQPLRRAFIEETYRTTTG